MTIKQLNEASIPHPDAKPSVDGVEISSITFVGKILNISAQATNTTFKLDDGTGTIEVKQWLDPDSQDQASRTEKLVENTYARVHGTLKSFNNKRHVGSRPGGIRPIKDMNEVQYHLLEATAVHLHFTKGPPGQKGVTGNGNTGTGAQDGFNDAGAQKGNRVLPAGLSQMARRVYNHLNTSPQTNEGLHMQDIAQAMTVDANDVGKAGDELVSHGLIYTTVDDYTWAILDEF